MPGHIYKGKRSLSAPLFDSLCSQDLRLSDHWGNLQRNVNKNHFLLVDGFYLPAAARTTLVWVYRQHKQSFCRFPLLPLGKERKLWWNEHRSPIHSTHAALQIGVAKCTRQPEKQTFCSRFQLYTRKLMIRRLMNDEKLFKWKILCKYNRICTFKGSKMNFCFMEWVACFAKWSNGIEIQTIKLTQYGRVAQFRSFSLHANYKYYKL